MNALADGAGHEPRARAQALLARACGARRVAVERWERLSGGAIQENVALDVIVEGGPHAGRHEWVLRTDAPSAVAVSHTRPEEFAAPMLRALIKRTPGLKPPMLDDVLLGCAFPEGEQGFNIARIVSLMAGIPDSVPAGTINRFCSSDGRYRFLNEAPGTYKVTAELTGFVTLVREAVVVVGSSVELPFAMRVGGVQGTVTV